MIRERFVLERALKRCSRADRELVLDHIRSLEMVRAAAEYRARRARDLERVVKDQLQHIKNLEAEVLGRSA